MNHDPQKQFMKDKTGKTSKDQAEAATVPGPEEVAAIEKAALDRVAAGRPGGKRDAVTAKLNPAFDSWLEGKLHKIFDTASTEPLPQDLMNLLERIDQAEAARKEKK